jgi:hypothetical protein
VAFAAPNVLTSKLSRSQWHGILDGPATGWDRAPHAAQEHDIFAGGLWTPAGGNLMTSARLGVGCAILLSLLMSGDVSRDLAAQTSAQTYTWSGKYYFNDGQWIAGDFWLCLWLGYGTGSVSRGELSLKPKAATTALETHSALVRSEFVLGSDWDISVRMTTDKQLRTRKVGKRQVPAPNPWEVGWLVANMREDGSAGLYFILKTNGVELGAYKENGDQVFLFTAPTPQNRIGSSYLCRLVRIGNQVAAASLDALGNWPMGDRIGLYTEDAAVRFGPVSVVTASAY